MSINTIPTQNNNSFGFKQGDIVKDNEYSTYYAVVDILPLKDAFDFVIKNDPANCNMDINDWLADYKNDDLFYVLKIANRAPKDYNFEGLQYVMVSVNNDGNDGERTLTACVK